jgi:hypothetical protein
MVDNYQPNNYSILTDACNYLDFNLDFYTQVMDLSYLLQQLDDAPLTSKYRKLNEALCELIEDFGLVGFHPLCIEVR